MSQASGSPGDGASRQEKECGSRRLLRPFRTVKEKISSSPQRPRATPRPSPSPSSSPNSSNRKADQYAQPADISCWQQARLELKETETNNNNKYIKILDQNLDDVQNIGLLPEKIAQIAEHRVKQLSKDGVLTSSIRNTLNNIIRFMMTAEKAAMGLARLDPYHVAPIVLGGIFSIVRLVENDTEGHRAAVKMVDDILPILTWWSFVDEKQIRPNRCKRLVQNYEELRAAVVGLFRKIMVLLGTIMEFLDTKWRQTLNSLNSGYMDWGSILNSVLAADVNCKIIERKVSIEEKTLERESKILHWLSSFDARGQYESVLEATKIKTEYRKHGQWLIDDTRFRNWRTLGKSAILWLNGTIGTGKTTLMARASLDLLQDRQMGRLALFFFQKAEGTVRVETCLQSLIRQLSWNQAEGQVEQQISDAYDDWKDRHHETSALKSGECVELLRQLLRKKECFIMIDGMDECEDCNLLLDKMREISRTDIEQSNDEHMPLHVMLSSRDDVLGVRESFVDCYVITTNEERSKEDQDIYITKELNERRRLRPGQLFFASQFCFPERLEKILRKQGRGLFRWIQIQIEIFTHERFRTDDEIEDQLVQVSERVSHPDLHKEYSRLLDLLGENGRNRKRAVQMLQLIACSFEPLSFEDLGEAMTGLNDNSTITADDTRRILVGFVTEYDFSEGNLDYGYDSKDEEFVWSKIERPAVRLAHASVREFLEECVLDEKGFSIYAQHKQAAAICLSYLNREKNALLNIAHVVEESNETLSYQQHKVFCRDRLSRFLRYCCYAWHIHLEVSLIEDRGLTSKIIEHLRQFLSDKTYNAWLSLSMFLLYDLQRKVFPYTLYQKFEGYQFRMQLIVNNETLSGNTNPGYLIAALSIPELMLVPEIRMRVDPLSVSLAEESVFLFAVRHASTPTVKQFINEFPEFLKSETILSQAEPIGFRGQSRTALHCAVESQDLAKVKLLLENGANLWAVNSEGRTALDYAIVGTARSFAISKFLVKRMGARNVPIESLNDLMVLAVQFDLRLIAWLLEVVVDPEFMSFSRPKWSPLHQASYINSREEKKSSIEKDGRSFEAGRMLIEAKPQLITPVDNFGRTPLHFASGKMLSLILANGADIFAMDLDGSAPLHYARSLHDANRLLEEASKLEADGILGSVQRLLRLRNKMGEIAADKHYLWLKKNSNEENEEEDLSPEKHLRIATERDGGELYEFSKPNIVEVWESQTNEGGRDWKEILKQWSLDNILILTEEELEFAKNYLEWHAKRSKELADQYEESKQKALAKHREQGQIPSS